MMNNNVSWLLELNINGGNVSAAKELMEEMVSATKENESNTLSYEWNFSEDGQSCHIYERYLDSDAVMVHAQAFGEKFAERFMSVFAPARLTVYGNPDSNVKEGLAPFGPEYMSTEGGFTR
jgi:quinol monooxygenase YgiN